MTAETARRMNSQLIRQLSRKLDGKEVNLKSQILQAIDSTIAKKVLSPSEI